MIRRPPRSTQSRSSAASDVYKRQGVHRGVPVCSLVAPSFLDSSSLPYVTLGKQNNFPLQRRLERKYSRSSEHRAASNVFRLPLSPLRSRACGTCSTDRRTWQRSVVTTPHARPALPCPAASEASHATPRLSSDPELASASPSRVTSSQADWLVSVTVEDRRPRTGLLLPSATESTYSLSLIHISEPTRPY